jgi:predicted nucleic acid-binding protein
MVLCDSTVIIDAINNVSKAQEELLSIGSQNVLISVITEMEVLAGAINKEHQLKLEKKLKQYNILQIDNRISSKATELIKKYKLSHGLLIPDAIIAASCLVYDFKLLTDNVKDFKFIEGISLYE